MEDQKESILENIVKGECQFVEFKETFRWNVEKNIKDKSLKKEIVKAICAFANSKGGFLYIGVKDDKTIQGIERDLNTYNLLEKANAKDKMFQDIKRKLVSDLGLIINDLTEISYHVIESKDIISIKVLQSQEPIFVNGKIYYYREGPASIQITNPKQLYEYWNAHFKFINNFKKKVLSIPEVPNPFDKRIPILQKILKNQIFEYYYKFETTGSINDQELIKRISKLINTLIKFDNSSSNRYMDNNGRSISHRNIVKELYGVDLSIFKNQIKKGKIAKEKITRDVKTLSGDVAFEMDSLYFNKDIYKNSLYNLNYLAYERFKENPFFKEPYNVDNFIESLEILVEYELIIPNSAEINKISKFKNIYLIIPDILKLEKYIKWRSINYLLFREEF